MTTGDIGRAFDEPPERGSAAEEAALPPEEAAMPYHPERGFADAPQSGIALVRERNEQRLMAIEGVVGVAAGRTAIGDDAVVLYLTDASARSRVPSEIEGFLVETVVTGQIDAYGISRG